VGFFYERDPPPALAHPPGCSGWGLFDKETSREPYYEADDLAALLHDSED
jgi:hypothetical protein